MTEKKKPQLYQEGFMELTPEMLKELDAMAEKERKKKLEAEKNSDSKKD